MAKFFFVLGFLIMLLSGGCSLWVMSIAGTGGIGNLILLIGGLPFALGVVMFLVAKAQINKNALKED